MAEVTAEERNYYDEALEECRIAIPEASTPCSVCVNYTVRSAVEAQKEKDAKIADGYAVKEREDVAVAGSSIMYYSELIADDIRKETS